MAETLLLVGGVALAVAGWTFLFRRPSAGIWSRTWLTAGALSAYALVAVAVTDRWTELVGPVSPASVAAGVLIGGAWLVATHVGHYVLCRIFPGFLAQISDLYSLRKGDRVRTMVGPVVAMAVAEELFFRGFVQGAGGLVASIAIYTAVQLVAGKWALTLAALLGGTVWGGLTWWTDGLVAPIVAHVLWTGTLSFLWPLRGCGAEVGGADVAPLAAERDADGHLVAGSVEGTSDAAACDGSPSAPVVEAPPPG